MDDRPPLLAFGLEDLRLAFLELVGLEHHGDGAGEKVDEGVHFPPKLPSVARFEVQHLGGVFVVEVVNVADVERHAGAARDLLQDALDRGLFAGSGEALYDDVEPARLDGETELDRLDGPLLADDVEA